MHVGTQLTLILKRYTKNTYLRLSQDLLMNLTKKTNFMIMRLKYSLWFSLFLLLILSCNNTSAVDNDSLGDTVKTDALVSSQVTDSNHLLPTKDSQLDCKSLLLDIVKSSNFPLEGVDKSLVDIYIDNVEGAKVFCKVFIKTQGTGTLGWVEFDAKEKTLINKSANLDVPQPLTFDNKYLSLLKTSCPELNLSDNKITAQTDESVDLISILSKAPAIKLPLKYDFYFSDTYKGINIPDQLAKKLDLDSLDNLKIYKLPQKQSIYPIIVSGSDLAGQEKLYLVTLDHKMEKKGKLLLYDHKELESSSKDWHREYAISEKYDIILTDQTKSYSGSDSKVMKQVESKYIISDNGSIVKAS